MSAMANYNTMEMMIVAAARTLENRSTAGVGTGAPVAAGMLAQKTHATDLVIMFEAGGISPDKTAGEAVVREPSLTGAVELVEDGFVG